MSNRLAEFQFMSAMVIFPHSSALACTENAASSALESMDLLFCIDVIPFLVRSLFAIETEMFDGEKRLRSKFKRSDYLG
ncbi:hypothetical protein A138_20685 [Vibrio crassostreae 9ZC77]|nr:hypothetical protein A138_20685 [Vibrio crassostreae 9ZC77]